MHKKAVLENFEKPILVLDKNLYFSKRCTYCVYFLHPGCGPLVDAFNIKIGVGVQTTLPRLMSIFTFKKDKSRF